MSLLHRSKQGASRRVCKSSLIAPGSLCCATVGHGHSCKGRNSRPPYARHSSESADERPGVSRDTLHGGASGLLRSEVFRLRMPVLR